MPETDGHGDTCGIDAMLSYLSVARDLPMTIAQVDSMRSLFIAHGWMNTRSYNGMVITSIAAAFQQIYNVQPVKVVPWDDSFQLDAHLAQFHDDLKTIYQTRRAVLWETHNGQALPDNQQNVFNHFVLAWGEDSLQGLGYYTANGDLLSALTHTTPVPPVWYTWTEYLRAEPRAYLVLPALGVIP